MDCRYLFKTRGGMACSKDKNLYVPTSFELSLYCRSGEYKSCPFINSTQHPSSLYHINPGSGTAHNRGFSNENRYGKRGASEGN
ncbi:MAG: hypothetical protein D6710_08785 [Nitrospirae bacterium]|nr:MAG: hypothetical protein D6710_08785 [Nitrospirota bacterium]